MSDNTDDEKLTKRASQGDETAFLLLYERHRDAMFRFAYRMLGSVESAEDVTQECFLSLIARGTRFDPSRASLRTYLFAAVRNLSINHMRRSGNEITVEEMPEERHLCYIQEPLDRLIGQEVSAEVRKAVSNLPPLQREALILFEYEELSLAEIAAVVGADIGTVKSRLFRAREGLRRLLSPYFKSASRVVSMKEALL